MVFSSSRNNPNYIKLFHFATYRGDSSFSWGGITQPFRHNRNASFRPSEGKDSKRTRGCFPPLTSLGLNYWKLALSLFSLLTKAIQYLPFIGNLYLFTHFLLPKQTNKPATLSLSLCKVFLHVESRVEEYWGHFPEEPYYLTNKKTGWELSPAPSMAESLTPGLPLTPQDFSIYQCLAVTLHSITDIWVD